MNIIDEYLRTGKRQTLLDIQANIKNNDLRQKIIKDLLKDKQRYIQVFPTEVQIKIVIELASQIKPKEYLASIVTWMLPYVSNKALKRFYNLL